MTTGKIRCAVVGYGPAFNWGQMHARWMQAVPAMDVVAICDRAPERAAKAQQDFPEAHVGTDLCEMLRREDIDLVSIVTPHHTHASLAIACLTDNLHIFLLLQKLSEQVADRHVILNQ